MVNGDRGREGGVIERKPTPFSDGRSWGALYIWMAPGLRELKVEVRCVG